MVDLLRSPSGVGQVPVFGGLSQSGVGQVSFPSGVQSLPRTPPRFTRSRYQVWSGSRAGDELGLSRRGRYRMSVSTPEKDVDNVHTFKEDSS
jgi:hypothetical protein